MNYRNIRKLGFDKLDFLSEVAWNKYMNSHYVIFKMNNGESRYFIFDDLTMELMFDAINTRTVNDWFEKLKDWQMKQKVVT